MINIKTIFINHFASDRITDNRLKAFCLNHINKLTAWLTVHTDPVMSELLTAVLTKYNAYFGAITNEATKLTIQQGLTIAADNAWTALLNFISQQEGTVKGVFGKDSPEYEQFYPHGITEYIRSTRLNRDTIVARYLAVATDYSADLPVDFVADYTALKNDWNTKYTTQQNQIGLVKDANSQTANTREPLEVQLSENMLIIGSKNVGYPDRVGDFFTQSIIRRKTDTFPATSIEVRGQVTVGGSGDPVVGATVTIGKVTNPEPEVVTTDENGKYKVRGNHLNNNDEGEVRLTVDAPGFQFFEFFFNVELGEIYTINPSMNPAMLKAA